MGGWVGAGGAIAAIVVTGFIANWQLRAERRARKLRLDQYIDLIVVVVNQLEAVLESFFSDYHGGIVSNLKNFEHNTMNLPEFHAARDLAFIPIMDWPSIATYKSFKRYWNNTLQALSLAAQTVAPGGAMAHSAALVLAVGERDSGLGDLRNALHEARTLSV